MNRISALALVAIASMATCTAAFGQSAVKANIPFDFTVGNTWMPAGHYTISTPTQQVVNLRNTDLAKTATIVGSHSFDESGSGSKLVFDKYGDQYFLHQVLCPSFTSLNLNLPQGKAEKKALSRALEAKLHIGEGTMVAAK